VSTAERSKDRIHIVTASGHGCCTRTSLPICTPIAGGGLTVVVLLKDCSVAPSPRRSLPELLRVGPGRVLQVPEVARCADRVVEQFLGFGRLACVPCVYGVLGQGPGWLLEQLLRGG
jgi:hypothetical protein